MARTNKHNYIKQKSTHRVLFSSFLYGARLASADEKPAPLLTGAPALVYFAGASMRLPFLKA